MRRSSAERRARRRNLFVEKVDKRTVWDRDNGICGICQEPVKYKSMTLDHVIPLAQNGTHCYANVQTAHEGCNLEKGDMVDFSYAPARRTKPHYVNRPSLA